MFEILPQPSPTRRPGAPRSPRRAAGRIAGALLAAMTFSAGMLAAQGEPKIAPSAARQIAVLEGIKAAKSTSQEKISSRLFLAILKQRQDPRLTELPDLRFVQPDADGKILVDIDTVASNDVKTVLGQVQQAGGELQNFHFRYRSLRARLPLNQVEAIASLPGVRKVQLARQAFTNAVNRSEGDVAHRAAEARNFFGVDGSGVKICVLSDGVNSLATAQATGDLPAVDILPGQAGSGDEGTAMLEIVHDLAPGATLGFATATTSFAQFAQNILDLRADGCDILVDDILYLVESPFQELEITEAVNQVTADGALYFSSAGNEANLNDLTSGTWEGNFNPNGTIATLGAGAVHNFGDGGQSQLVTFSAPVAILHWTDPFGASGNDYDLYVMNGALTTVFDASTDVQDGTGDPVELIGTVFTNERLVVHQFSGANRMINLIAFRGEVANQTDGCIRGHSTAVNAFATAAVDQATAGGGAFTGGAANPVEPFSCDGPRRIFFDVNGNLLPGAPAGDFSAAGGVVRAKPDIAAADGVATSAPGFNPFFGTSAAAPHAAAIAGLVKQARPAFTPAQIRTALENFALDIEAPGHDRDSGAGIVMAYQTLQGLGVTPSANLDAGAAVPSQAAGDGDAFVEIGEDWNLSIPLTNSGGATATAISAVLSSSTPGVLILFGTSTYPDLAAGASAGNDTPFTFTTTSALACGTVIEFTLTVNYSGGVVASESFTFTLGTGAPGAPVTFSYTGPVVPIPDGNDLSGSSPGAPVSAVLPVAGLPGNVFDVDLRIDGDTCNTTVGSTTVGIDHSFVNDLELTLIAPNGTSVLVVDNTDGSGNNFCQTLLDDESAGPNVQTLVTANAPFTGSFRPNAVLSGLDGGPANGNWQLQAQDFFSQDPGNIRAFSLIITPAVCDAPALTTNVTATKAVTGGDLRPGGTVTYTVTLTNSGTGAQPDNAGDEFTDTLPAGLTVLTPTATSGTVSGAGVNPVTWNGAILAGQSVTITIPATITAAATSGQTFLNQGNLSFDANRDGTNEATGVTDNPGGGPDEPTPFTVQGAIHEIPTLSEVGFALLIVMLSLAAFTALRRRNQKTGA